MIDDISYFRRNVVRNIVIFLFWLSGISTALSVIVWIRLFKSIFGNVLFVTNSIMTLFLIGIALGSYYFGKKIDPQKNDLHIFMRAEFGIGLVSLFIFIIFPFLIPLTRFIAIHSGQMIFMVSVFKFIILSILILPPSIMIGAALPVLTRFFIQSSNRVSQEIGKIFGVKIFGVAVGSFLSGFFFLPIFGVKQTLLLGAGLNLLTAGLMRFLLNQTQATIQVENEFYDQRLKHLAAEPNAQSKFLTKTVIIGFGASGFVFISYLLLWFRGLFLVIGTDTYAFHVILTAFAMGLSIGALLFPRIMKSEWNLVTIFALAEIVIGFLGVVSILLLPNLIHINEILGPSTQTTDVWNWKIFVDLFDSSAIVLLPAFLMGAMIPIVGKIMLSDYEERGKRIGSMYAIQLFGAILGLNITSAFIIPNIGIQKSFLFLVLINFLIGLVVLFFASLEHGKFSKTAIVFGVVMSLFLVSLFIPSNMLVKLFENKIRHQKIIYLREGSRTTVTVHQSDSSNALTLTTNGVTLVSSTRDWLTCLRTLGHLPLLLHPGPDTVLTIGFKNGETFRSVLSHPVKQVYCIESISEIIDASPILNQFGEIQTIDPRYRLIEMDGKNYNLMTNKKYDVIINDLVHPAFGENGRFYTRNFFLSCRRNLKADGIVATGIPLYKMSLEDFRVVLHTFQSVFPTASLWYANNCVTPYAFLIGSLKSDFKINYHQMLDKIKDQNVLTNLNRIGMDNIYEVLDCFIIGPKVIEQLTKEVQINSDNSPYLEFSTPRTADIPVNWNQILQFIASYRESVFQYLINIDTNRNEREITKVIIENYYQSTENVLRALSFELMGEPDKAVTIYRQVLMMNRFDRGAIRFLDSYYDSLLIASPQTPAELTENATIYYQKMEYEDAIHLLNQALKMKSDYAPAYFGLGINYEILGDLEKAKKMYQQTLTLLPNLQQAQERMDSISVKLKKQAQAAAATKSKK